MAIDAKVSLLNMAERRMSTEITAETMGRVLAIMSDVMERFDIREIPSMETQNEDLLDCYMDAMKVQGRSEKTLARYRYILERMTRTIGVPTRRITVYHLRNYIAKEQARGIKDSTLEGVRQVFSAYFNWLQRESLIDKNPTANLGAIKCAKHKKATFTDVEIDALKSNCKTQRDRAIVTFLASTGCRVSEVVGLDRGSIDFARRRCIVHGKGNKERTAYFDGVTAITMQRYLNTRTDDNPALFVGKRGERLQPGGVRFMLNNLADRAGVDHVHPHKFRRTLATELARHGMPIQKICAVLGHEKIDTTMTYVMQDENEIDTEYRRYAM